MSFPASPFYKQKHTDSQGQDFYWIGGKWVKPGTYTNSPIAHDVKDPDIGEGFEHGAKWVNMESGTTFEFVYPGVWRKVCQTPSIQISFGEPTTQPDGAPLIDGDMWFDPQEVSIGIYYGGTWYDVIGSAVSKEITVKPPRAEKAG